MNEINHHTFSDVMEFVADVQALHPEAKLIDISSRDDYMMLRFKLQRGEQWVLMPFDMTYEEREALAETVEFRAEGDD